MLDNEFSINKSILESECALGGAIANVLVYKVRGLGTEVCRCVSYNVDDEPHWLIPVGKRRLIFTHFELCKHFLRWFLMF